MNKAILLKTDNCNGLYINGKLVEEGHNFNLIHLYKLSKKYNFYLFEMRLDYLLKEDIEQIKNNGSFPKDINNFKKKY